MGRIAEHTEPGPVPRSPDVADAVGPTEVVFTPIGSVACGAYASVEPRDASSQVGI